MPFPVSVDIPTAWGLTILYTLSPRRAICVVPCYLVPHPAFNSLLPFLRIQMVSTYNTLSLVKIVRSPVYSLLPVLGIQMVSAFDPFALVNMVLAPVS